MGAISKEIADGNEALIKDIQDWIRGTYYTGGAFLSIFTALSLVYFYAKNFVARPDKSEFLTLIGAFGIFTGGYTFVIGAIGAATGGALGLQYYRLNEIQKSDFENIPSFVNGDVIKLKKTSLESFLRKLTGDPTVTP